MFLSLWLGQFIQNLSLKKLLNAVRNKSFTTLSWKDKARFLTQMGRLNADMLKWKPLRTGATIRSVIRRTLFVWTYRGEITLFFTAQNTPPWSAESHPNSVYCVIWTSTRKDWRSYHVYGYFPSDRAWNLVLSYLLCNKDSYLLVGYPNVKNCSWILCRILTSVTSLCISVFCGFS